MAAPKAHQISKEDLNNKTVVVEEVAREVARRYRRRCWWAEERDLVQEARKMALEACEKWNPDHELKCELYWYVWRAVVMAMRTYLYKIGCPVSGNPHRMETLAENKRSEISEVTLKPFAVTPAESTKSGRVATWRVKVHAVVVEKIRAAGGEEVADVVEMAIFDEARVIDLANERQLDQYAIRRIVRKVKADLSKDTELMKLWEERP